MGDENSRLDRLTGLPTPHNMPASITDRDPLVIFVDVDALIWLNDQHGHEAGDRAIIDIAVVVRRVAATLDGAVAYRVDGDEFLLVVPRANVDSALEVAEGLVGGVRALRLPFKRLDQPERDIVEVNAVVARLTTARMKRAFGEYGITAACRDALDTLRYEQKQRAGIVAGVVVDATAVDWI